MALGGLAAGLAELLDRLSAAKDDAEDLIPLANIPRTDRHAHRPMPSNSELVSRPWPYWRGPSRTRAVRPAAAIQVDPVTAVGVPPLHPSSLPEQRRPPHKIRHRFSAESLRRSSARHPGQRQSCTVFARRVKNNRLAATAYVWAFSALIRSPGARAHCDRRKAHADRHTATSSTGFSDASTTACKPASPTPNRPHSRPLPIRQLLDLLAPSDVFFLTRSWCRIRGAGWPVPAWFLPQPVHDPNLLYPSTCPQGFGVGCVERVEDPVEGPGEVSPEDAADLAWSLAFCLPV